MVLLILNLVWFLAQIVCYMLNAPPVNLAEKKISTLQHLEISFFQWNTDTLLNTVNFTVKLGDEEFFGQSKTLYLIAQLIHLNLNFSFGIKYSRNIE